MRQVVRALTAIAGLIFVVFGLWALFGPDSFYDQLATYPPRNIHFLHDIGAFQTGIGATLLFALFRRDALQVALWGTAVGAVLHAISHFIDQDLGGRSSDPYLVSLLGLVVLVAAVLHSRQLADERRRRR